MTRDALTIGIDGQQALPESMDDWDRWISASSSRNYLLRNPLVDWLERYGEAGGFVSDTDLPGYDERLEFVPFIMRKGNEFEAAIVRHLSSITSVLTVAYFRMNMYLRGIKDAADVFLRSYEEGLGKVVQNLGFRELCAAAQPLPHPVLWIPASREMGDPGATDERATTDYYEFVSEALRCAYAGR